MGIKKKNKVKLGKLDYIDYKREMAAKGELHALDTASGGLFGLSQLKKRENYSSKFPSVKKKTYIAIVKQALLPVWEDRNISNNGTKLNP